MPRREKGEKRIINISWMGSQTSPGNDGRINGASQQEGWISMEEFCSTAGKQCQTMSCHGSLSSCPPLCPHASQWSAPVVRRTLSSSPSMGEDWDCGRQVPTIAGGAFRWDAPRPDVGGLEALLRGECRDQTRTKGCVGGGWRLTVFLRPWPFSVKCPASGRVFGRSSFFKSSRKPARSHVSPPFSIRKLASGRETSALNTIPFLLAYRLHPEYQWWWNHRRRSTYHLPITAILVNKVPRHWNLPSLSVTTHERMHEQRKKKKISRYVSCCSPTLLLRHERQRPLTPRLHKYARYLSTMRNRPASHCILEQNSQQPPLCMPSHPFVPPKGEKKSSTIYRCPGWGTFSRHISNHSPLHCHTELSMRNTQYRAQPLSNTHCFKLDDVIEFGHRLTPYNT